MEIIKMKPFKQTRFYKTVFAKFERKDFMQIILYALAILSIHTFMEAIGFSKLTEQEAALFQLRMVSFFSVLIIIIMIHYVFRFIRYDFGGLK